MGLEGNLVVVGWTKGAEGMVFPCPGVKIFIFLK